MVFNGFDGAASLSFMWKVVHHALTAHFQQLSENITPSLRGKGKVLLTAIVGEYSSPLSEGVGEVPLSAISGSGDGKTDILRRLCRKNNT